MITGVRGTGKTVFMTEIMFQLSRQNQWVVVELNPTRNLLEDLAAKLNSDRLLAGILQKAGIDLSFFGIGVRIEGSHPAVNIETAISNMLESLKKNSKRVLIAIDEVTRTGYSFAFQVLGYLTCELLRLIEVGVVHRDDRGCL